MYSYIFSFFFNKLTSCDVELPNFLYVITFIYVLCQELQLFLLLNLSIYDMQWGVYIYIHPVISEYEFNMLCKDTCIRLFYSHLVVFFVVC